MMDDKRLTKEQRQKIAQAVDSFLSEVFDGYVVVGFVAGNGGSPMQIAHANHALMAYALNQALSKAEVDDPDEEDDQSGIESD